MKWLARFWDNWVTAYYEIDNWFYVRKVIRKHKNTADWDRFQLRSDWVARIYTVLNPQLPLDKGDTKEVLGLKYTERLKPINIYLDNIGLGQSVTAAWEEIPGTDSYLVVYTPIFNVITVWKVIWFITFWAVFFLTKLDSWVWQGITQVWNAVF